jgi:flagellar hook-basal body protein
MVASATSSVVNKGANGTNKVSNANVPCLDLTQPFARAGFDQREGGQPWDWSTTITIRSAAYVSEGGQGEWTSEPLSSYTSVDEFLAAVNNQDSAPCTISYDAHTDTFTVINDAPGTAILITQSADNGFVDAAKFQVYNTNPGANFLWNGQTATTQQTAVFNATTLPAKGILELDPITNKVIEHWRDTSENCNNVLELTTEIPSTTAISTTAAMPARVFGGDLWPHTTRTRGTGKDFFRQTNGQIRESIWVNPETVANIETQDEAPLGVGHQKAGTSGLTIERVFTLDRNDVDPTRIEVTIDNERVYYVRPGHPTPPSGTAYFTFSDDTGPGGKDELIWHRNGAGSDLSNDDLLEINYVRLNHSNLAPSDVFVPNGNEGPEDITFSPNTGEVVDYEIYSPDDKKRNGFPEIADSGDPATAEKSHDFLYSKTIKAYDSQGEEKDLTFVFEKLDTKKWLWTVQNPVETELLAGYGILIFNYDGSYNRYESETYQSPSDPKTYDGDNGSGETGRAATIGYRGIYIDQPALGYPADFGGSPPHEMGAAIMKVEVDFRPLLEQADLLLNASAVGLSQNGYPMGRLNEITIDKEGIIWGNYTNGQQQPKAQIALADFTNPGGLDRVAGTLFKETANSGDAKISEAKVIGSEILSGKLEKSNVDLATQFVEMILAERGFQATGRIITQTDRMVMELMRLRM